jgi:hypothetical protein
MNRRCVMETEWMADRAKLRCLLQDGQPRTIRELARILKRSVGWVVKWMKRLDTAAPGDAMILHSQSRQRKTMPACMSVTVMTAILLLRTNPPQHLGRVPGPKAIMYYLGQDPALQGEVLPQSASTIYRILKHAGLIATRRLFRKQLDPPAPQTVWELDLVNVDTVPPDPDGKRSQMVETLNVIDPGTAIMIGCVPRADFNAETILIEMASLVKREGVIGMVCFDRDPRMVGSQQQGDMPSAFVRFWLCLPRDTQRPVLPSSRNIPSYCVVFTCW